MPGRLGDLSPSVGVLQQSSLCLWKKKQTKSNNQTKKYPENKADAPPHLSLQHSEQRWLHPLHRLGEVRGALLTAVPTKLSRVCWPLVGKGCRAPSFRVGQNAGATEQCAPVLRNE